MAEQRGWFDIRLAYQVLGVTPGTSQTKIKSAYRELVKIWHPDRFTTKEDKLIAEEKIKEINAAYQALKSEEVEDNGENKVAKAPVNPVNSSGTRVNVHKSVSAAEFFYQQGVEKVQQGDYEQAIAFFTQAIKANPYYIEAYKYRGLSCSQLGLEMRATADLNKAASLEWHFRGKKPQTTHHQSYHRKKPSRVQYHVKTSYSERVNHRRTESIWQKIRRCWFRLWNYLFS